MNCLPTLNLIEIALEKTKEARKQIIGMGNVINSPTTPKSWHSYFYLTLREAINIGCAEAVKILPNPYKKSIAYSVLKKAVQNIFKSRKETEIINFYNRLLEELIGTH